MAPDKPAKPANPPVKPARSSVSAPASQKLGPQASEAPNQDAATPQSNIVRHVPSRARSVDQILDFAERTGITNERLVKAGVRMNENLLFGSNQRCVAMLEVFKSIMDDIRQTLGQQTTIINQTHDSLSPTAISSSRSIQNALEELQKALKSAIEFLDFCRPLSISMSNAYKLVKEEILKLNQTRVDEAIASFRLVQESDRALSSSSPTSPNPLTEEVRCYDEQRRKLREFIDTFIHEEIWSAQRGICENIEDNITTNDVILVYGCSTIVQHVLVHARSRGKTFRVIVVDTPPHFSGRRMLSFLHGKCIDVSYTLINSLSYVMRFATKVLLGANSMLANGYVMSHIGTSQVALMANAFNVPTLVCCETYKLNDRVYVDSFGCNEVDSGHELGSVLNLRYDLTPPEFISMVINEKNTVPAKSVPALLRLRAEKTNATYRIS